MRLIILVFFICPLFCVAQRTDVFIKLNNSAGQQVKGDVVARGFEKNIQAASITTSGKNNTQISFTMTISGASAELKNALANGETLLNGQVSVMKQSQSTGAPVLSYSIKMENIIVSTCFDAMGCNSSMNTTVTLQATRAGYTYYEDVRSGMQTISRKFGWDASSNTEWTKF